MPRKFQGFQCEICTSTFGSYAEAHECENLHAKIDGFYTDGDNLPALACPICDHECAHVAAVERHKAGEVGHIWGTYGGASVAIKGECGHNWLLLFQDHKGRVLIETLPLPATPPEE